VSDPTIGATIIIATHKILAPPLTLLFLSTLIRAYRLNNAHTMRNIKPKVPPIADVIRYIFDALKN
jgi:hypothetical protein